MSTSRRGPCPRTGPPPASPSPPPWCPPSPENGKDLEEIDQTVRKALRFVLVDQAEQVLAEALCCLGGGAEAGRAMDRKLPGEKSRGTARLRQ